MTLRHVHRSGNASPSNLQEGSTANIVGLSTAESLDTSRGDILVSIMIEQTGSLPVSVLWPNGQRDHTRRIRHVVTEGHFKGLCVNA